MKQVGKFLLSAFVCASLVYSQETTTTNTNLAFLQDGDTPISRADLNNLVQSNSLDQLKGVALVVEYLLFKDKTDLAGGVEDIPKTSTNILIQFILDNMNEEAVKNLSLKEARKEAIEQGFSN